MSYDNALENFEVSILLISKPIIIHKPPIRWYAYKCSLKKTANSAADRETTDYNFARNLLNVELVIPKYEATDLLEIRDSNLGSCSITHLSLSIPSIPKKL